jgi:hypothetical protein
MKFLVRQSMVRNAILTLSPRINRGGKKFRTMGGFLKSALFFSFRDLDHMRTRPQLSEVSIPRTRSNAVVRDACGHLFGGSTVVGHGVGI